MAVLPTLYSFRRCPYAMRARMALGSAGIAYQTVEVSLRAKPLELIALSPKGTVPVMKLTDGAVLEQSLDIMRWALLQNDPEGWLSTEDPAEINQWIALCDDTFKPLLDRYKYANRHPELSMEEHRVQAVLAFILPLENALQAKMDKGCRPSLADAAIFPFLRQFAAVDQTWFDSEPLPQVQNWLKKWLLSDLFATIMKK
jgi:glutathione S-transferase